MFAIYSPIIALRSTLVNRLEGEGKEMVPETPLWQEFERDKTAKLDHMTWRAYPYTSAFSDLFLTATRSVDSMKRCR
jgi:hypothetical protein